MKQYIVAFDLGSYKISGAIAEIKGVSFIETIAVAMTKSKGIKAPYIKDINLAAEDLKTCKNKLEVLSGIKCTSAYVSIPVGVCEYIEFEQEVNIQNESSITEKFLNELVEAVKTFNVPSNKYIIHAMLMKYSIDGYDNIIDPIGMTGNKMIVRVKLAVVSDILINSIEKVFELNDIEIKGYEISSLAEYYLTKDFENDKKYDAIVNVGAKSINVSILHRNNILYSHFIPVGEDSITNDLMQCLKINEDEAINLKMNYNLLIDDKSDDEELMLNNTSRVAFPVKKSLIIDIIDARIEELLELIKQCLEFSKLYEQIENIIFSGSGLSIYDNLLKNVGEMYKKNVTKIEGTCYNKSNKDFSIVLGILDKVNNDIKNEDKLIDDLSIEEQVEEEINVFGKIKKLIKQFF